MLLKAVRNVLLILLCVVNLGACGFRLAGTSELPAELKSIYLSTSNFSETQRKALRRSLEAGGARLVAQSDPEAVRLSVTLKEQSDQQLATGASGDKVTRISRSLDFNLKSAAGKTISAARTLSQQKDITLDDNNLLSSNREKENVTRELEQALYDQLVRQLSLI